jgi:hypothetical protein
VDTTFIYKTNTPFGTLDLRIAKSPSRYYYLQEDKTFSFRETAPGVKTNTYLDMTAWDSSPYKQGNLREKNGTQDYFTLNYRLLFPANYDQTYSDGYPLIVMMHGAGERGNCWDADCFWATTSWNPTANSPAAPTAADQALLNNDYNLTHGGEVHLQARNLAGNMLPNDPNLPARAFPGFVLFPQNLNGWVSGNVQDVVRLVRLLVKRYHIDPNRIYVHGLSNGGMATYDLLKRAPWLFAAALPMSAPTESSTSTPALVGSVSHIPLWIFQGGQDTGPTPSRTQGYVKKFRDAGMLIRYNEYPSLGHGVWNTAYAEPDFFSWMLQKNKANIHLFAGVSTICETNGQGVRMELAAGFFHYEWERNGVILTDATGPLYVANTPGVYRARFSRKQNPSASDWNRWSEPVTVTSQTVTKPVIAQTGTVALKGLDNYPYALLHSEEPAPHYYWYKNDALLNLPGSMDDTTRHVKLSSGDCSAGPCAGNGVYTLVVAGNDFCPSPPSDGKYVFFNNQAPLNVIAPTNFSATPLPDAQVRLTWSDVSTNENGFEIWRRRQTGSTTYSPWSMAPLAEANITTLVDRGLVPSSTYQYKIRAVGNSGISSYNPSASNQYVTVVTSGDSQSPTVPQNLTAEATAIQEITLRWSPSTDNTGIQQYEISYSSNVIVTGGPATSYVLRDLPLNQNYTFVVRARDLGGNLSAASNTTEASTYVNGLFYEHSTGAFTDIDLINWSFVEYKGSVSNFTLAPKTQEDYYNFRFDGFLYIADGGTYQFQTSSDDGSRLTLDGAVLVDNDGQHGTQTVTSSSRSISSGPHRIEVKYFEYAGGEALTVRYKGRDTHGDWVVIPDAALRSGYSSESVKGMQTTQEDRANATGRHSTDDEAKIDLYPNPSKPDDDITLKLNGGYEPVTVKLLDMMGQSYFEKTLPGGAAENLVEITPRARLNRGMYILVIHQGKATRKQTVIVKE